MQTKVYKKNNKYTPANNFDRALLFFASIALVAPIAYGQNKKITDTEARQTTNYVKATILTIIKEEVISLPEDEVQKSKIDINLTFDEKKLNLDANAWKKQTIRNRQNEIKRKFDEQKSFAQKYLNKIEDPVQKQAITKESYKFGNLNLSVDQESVSKVFLEADKDSVENQFLKQYQSLSSAPLPEFQYNLMDYISTISGVLYIPQALSQKVKDAILSRIAKDYGLDKKSKKPITESLKIEEMKVYSPKLSTWISKIFDPKNNNLGIIVAGAFFGFLLLISTFLLSKGFSRIAAGIAELKVTPESESSEGDSSVQEATPSQTTVVAEDSPHGSSKNTFDAAASSNALTSEMKTIRAQFAEIIAENGSLVSELLRDLFYEENGLEDFRDLLTFAGYKVLKPAMENLPPSCIEDLQIFLEDSRGENSSLLNGVEVTQRIYRDCITRITSSADELSIIQKLRHTLISAEDVILSHIVKDSDPKEIAVLLRVLTVERGNKVFKEIDPKKLKDAMDAFDTPLEELSASIESLDSKINQYNEAPEESASKSLIRFIMRLVRNANITDENSINALVAEDNWDIRREMMKTKLFYMDLAYFPVNQLKNILTSFDVAFRGEFLYLADEDLRNAIIGSLAEGSKLKEMVQTEMSLIERSEERKINAEKMMLQTKLQFLEKARALIDSDHSIVDTIIINKCKKLNLSLPSDLEKNADQAA